MIIIPAIDILGGCAVRLQKGDYDKVTIYSNDPTSVAKEFERSGAGFLHIVDLDGAKSGQAENYELIKRISSEVDMPVEIGGGIRTMERLELYSNAGVQRMILGTAALKDPDLLLRALDKYGERIAVGVDIKDEKVAVNGWTEVCGKSCDEFCAELERIGVKTIICTDISKDGMLGGTNLELYKRLNSEYDIDIVASGGVCTVEDVSALRDMGMYGAILGRALYAKTIDLAEAVRVAMA